MELKCKNPLSNRLLSRIVMISLDVNLPQLNAGTSCHIKTVPNYSEVLQVPHIVSGGMVTDNLCRKKKSASPSKDCAKV